MGWRIEGGGLYGVVVKFCSRWVFRDGRDDRRVYACRRSRVSRRSHRVELDGEDVDHVCGLVVVVQELDIDVEAVFVMGVA